MKKNNYSCFAVIISVIALLTASCNNEPAAKKEITKAVVAADTVTNPLFKIAPIEYT